VGPSQKKGAVLGEAGVELTPAHKEREKEGVAFSAVGMKARKSCNALGGRLLNQVPGGPKSGRGKGGT